MRNIIFGLALAITAATSANAGSHVRGLPGPTVDAGFNTGADGYAFKRSEYKQSLVAVTVVTFDTKDEYVAELRRHGYTQRAIPEAFSVIFKGEQQRCTIYMIDPARSYKPEYYGHELMHCFFGDWHKKEGNRY